MTEFQFLVEGVEDDTDLRDLHRWFAKDPDARGARLIEAPLEPGQMGGTAEAIGLVINGVAAMGGVLAAIAAWRSMLDQRRRDGGPKVTVTGPNGSSITMENTTPEQAAAIYQALEGGDDHAR
ncbi:effector-associated constant component EACC1 [Phytomonospora endophytica]|uniref:Uncharacterized protein n=1 Tax=Phytomonospora endophytica TaxID=714109 RepID=A0A841FIC3_9ACTN|nr:hypothetical protein [Phytomonospora endophytica]MBB6035505.1 hypothetical protein [Phytomonospora endophytica]GIG63742.1 hypothetical protein Pen01_00370 [Phytomonospora endophytica]